MDIVEGSYIPLAHKRIYLNSMNGTVMDKRPMGAYYVQNVDTLVNLNKVKFDITDARISCKDEEYMTMRLVKANFSGDFSTGDYSYSNPLQPYDKLLTVPANYLTSQLSNSTFMFAKQGYSVYGAEPAPVTTVNFQSKNIAITQKNDSGVVVNRVWIAFGSAGDGESSETYKYDTASIHEKLYHTPYLSNCDSLQMRNIMKAAMIWGFGTHGGPAVSDYYYTPITIEGIAGSLHITADEDEGWTTNYILEFGAAPVVCSGPAKSMIGQTGSWEEMAGSLQAPTGQVSLKLGVNPQQTQNLYLCSDIPTDSYASNKNANWWTTKYSSAGVNNDKLSRYSLETPTVLNNIIGMIPMIPQPVTSYEYLINIAGDTGITTKGHQYNYLYENLTGVGAEKRIGVKELSEITLTLYDDYLRMPHFNGQYWNCELEFTTYSRYKKS
jgi:hypothetical protein